MPTHRFDGCHVHHFKGLRWHLSPSMYQFGNDIQTFQTNILEKLPSCNTFSRGLWPGDTLGLVRPQAEHHFLFRRTVLRRVLWRHGCGYDFLGLVPGGKGWDTVGTVWVCPQSHVPVPNSNQTRAHSHIQKTLPTPNNPPKPRLARHGMNTTQTNCFPHFQKV